MGTSAYEMENLGALPEIPMEIGVRVPDRERSHQRERSRSRARGRVRTGERQTVSKLAVFGYIAAGVMLLMVVLSQIQLAVLSAETVELEGQMEALQEESARLQISYENLFSQTEVERYAKEELGMIEAGNGQVYYIGSDLGDSAEILGEKTQSGGGILTYLSGIFGALQEYLPFLS